MGKLNNGINGGFSGRVGPVVGATWKSINVMRARPPRKRGKSSEGQLRQMAKLKLMTPFIKPIIHLLNSRYDCVTEKMSCFNKALSYNMRNAIGGEYPAFVINFPRVVLGQGDLLNPDVLSAESVDSGQIRFNWIDNSGEGSARTNDHSFVALYCEALNQWMTSDSGSPRTAGSYTLDVVAFSGKAVHSYIGFFSANGKYVSESRYAGLIHIL